MKYSSLDNLAETLINLHFEEGKIENFGDVLQHLSRWALKGICLVNGSLLVEYELFFCSLPCHLSVRCRIPYTRYKLRHRLHFLLCSPYFILHKKFCYLD